MGFVKCIRMLLASRMRNNVSLDEIFRSELTVIGHFAVVECSAIFLKRLTSSAKKLQVQQLKLIKLLFRPRHMESNDAVSLLGKFIFLDYANSAPAMPWQSACL